MTEETEGAWEAGGRRLCRLRVSRTTPRWVLARGGSEGWDSQVKLEENEKEEVVGRTKGYGMLDCRNGPALPGRGRDTARPLPGITIHMGLVV